MFSFQTSNGIDAYQNGTLKLVEGENVIVVSGSYSYIDTNGKHVTYHYSADEDGYHAHQKVKILKSISGAVIASLTGGGLG